MLCLKKALFRGEMTSDFLPKFMELTKFWAEKLE
jgi:hypothetical protein